MSWKLSQFRTGDLVEVRCREEILATLDADGCIDGMPFMPEMFEYSGRRFRVAAVAHKSCDTATRTWTGRKLDSTVHLVGLRCNGAAHGGCQNDCNLFWKDAWLKPAALGTPSMPPAVPVPAPLPTLLPVISLNTSSPGCTEARLLEVTQRPLAEGETEPRYSCQATQHFVASRPLAWWNPLQYLRDLTTGNHRLGHILRVQLVATLSFALRHTPFGYRILKSFRKSVHRTLTGRDSPDVEGTIPEGGLTPTGRLHLQPGEWVRVKPLKEIEKTLKPDRTNRGMSFDQEMIPFCGRVFQVRSVITKIIDDTNGKMLTMKHPCITLQGAVCGAEYSTCRLMCPRAIPSFWREIWLERVEQREPCHESPQPQEAVIGNGSPA